MRWTLFNFLAKSLQTSGAWGAGYLGSEKTELCFESTLAMAQENGTKQALGKSAYPGQQRCGVSHFHGCHY